MIMMSHLTFILVKHQVKLLMSMKGILPILLTGLPVPQIQHKCR